MAVLKQLPRNPSLKSQFISAFSKGLSEGVENYHKEESDKKKKTAEKLKGFSGTFDKYVKAFKEELPGQIDKKTKEEMMLKARKLIESGEADDPEEAIRNVWDSVLESKRQESPEETSSFGQSLRKGLSPLMGGASGLAQALTPKGKYGIKDFGEDLYGAAAKLGDEALGAYEFPKDVAREAATLVGGKSEKMAPYIKAAKIAINLIDPLSRGNGLASDSLREDLAKFTKGASIPRNSSERIAQGSIFGIPGILGKGVSEAAAQLNLPQWVQEIAGLSAFILAGHGNLGGRMATNIQGFAKHAMKRAEKIGAKVGAPPEEILAESARQANVDMEKVNAGEGREIKKLNDALTIADKKAAETFEKSEKFNRKAREEIRQETQKKLYQSPLEKYYEPTVKEPTTEQGKLAKQMRQEPIRIKRDILLKEIKEPQFLEKSDMERRAKLSELKEAEFELKYGKKPTSHADIEKQIETQHAEMREYLHNPTAPKIEKIQKQIKLDQAAIAEAERLTARGELSGPRVVDEFIKIHDQYLEGYDALSKELSDFISKNKEAKTHPEKIKRAHDLKDLIDKMAEVGRAKVKIQMDKRKALGALEKPSGAFYKNVLRELKPEVDNFQKQLFKVNRVLTQESVKAKRIGKREIGKIERSPNKPFQTHTEKANTEKIASETKEAINEPTPENKEKLAKETGTTSENIGNWLNRILKARAKIKANPTEQTVLGKVKDFVFPRSLKKLGKQVINGLIIGTTSSILEEGLGVKIPIGILASLYATAGIGGSSFTFGVRSLVQYALNHMYAEDLKKHRYDSAKFREKTQKLNKKYSKIRLNKIMKIVKES